MLTYSGSSKQWGARRWLGLLLAVLTLAGWQASAQTNPVTSADIASLRNALAAGGLVQLQIQGPATFTATTPLIINVDTILDGTTNLVTISGGNTTRIFQVASNVHFTITNVTLSGGNSIGATGAAGTPGADAGTFSGTGGTGNPGGPGGNGLGGALLNQGFCTLVDCILVSNTATGGVGGVGGAGGNSQEGTGGNGGPGGAGGTALGGAIYNLGTLYLTNCTVAGNTTVAGAGGAGGTNGTGVFASYPGNGGAGALGAGGGLYNLGTTIVSNCTFNQNTVEGGNTQPAGGIKSGGTGLTGGVGGDGQGGAIASLGTNVIVNSTFFQNLVLAGAGGIGAGGSQGGGNGIGGNGGNGGNAWGGSVYNTGTLSLTNCSLATSVANGGTNGAAGTGTPNGHNGSVGQSLGDLIANNGGTFNLKNSLLAFTINGANPFRSTGVNASGTITDLGNNLSSDATPAFTTTNSFHNLDPLLVPLDNNGGLTLTMALQPGSPAIDAIYDNSAPPVDQRGFSRPVGARSDIGAFEYGAATNSAQVGGQVMLGAMPFPNVTVTAGGSSAVTDASGHYSFFLPAGLNYVVVPAPSAYFSPSSFPVALSTNNVTNVNFVATNTPTAVTLNSTNKTSIQFSFSVIPTFHYRVQASTNLVTNAWVDVATNVAVSNLLLFLDSTTNFPKRFFRTISP